MKNTLRTLGYLGVTTLLLILSSAGLVYAYSPIEIIIRVNGNNLGIGTSTSIAPLQLASTTASTGFRGQLFLTDLAATANKKHWYLSSDKGTFRIGTTSDAYATSTRFIIDANGNVGIGTSSPGTALDVNGDVTIEKANPDIGTGASTAIACYTTGGKLGYITITNLLGVTPACSAL